MKKIKTIILTTFVLLVAVFCTACFDLDENWGKDSKLIKEYQEQTFFMYGKEYDYCIDSQEELEAFVWYNILYRNNNVSFYKNFDLDNTSLSTLVFNYINSYPEYTGINVSSTKSYATLISGNEYKLQNFVYELPNDKLNTHYEYSSDVFGQNYTYTYDNGDLIISNGRNTTTTSRYSQDPDFKYEFGTDLNERNLPIDDEKGYEVYNSEQLFMVVQYGQRPIIDDNESVVATIYNNARTVLSQINTDDMSDYQKVLNIYNWVLSNNVYDYNILEYMEYTNDSSQLTFGNSPVFYLEGILYDLDNQLAVCDGISKTIALLCNMEGIECIKINGSTSGGNHAWNKVKLGDNWYAIDGTWAEIVCRDSENETMFELASHSYFLVSDEKLNELATRTTIWPLDEPQAIDYNYYENTTITDTQITQDLYVSTDEELIELLQIADNIDISNIEILLDEEYYDSMDNISGNLTQYQLMMDVNGITTDIELIITLNAIAFVQNGTTYYLVYDNNTSSWSVKTNGFFGYSTVAYIVDNKFSISGVDYIFYPIQQQDSIRTYIDNNSEISNNGYTIIDNRRISFFYSNGCLMIWLNYNQTHR